MTKQECAVLMAHTGIVLLQGDDLRIFYEYLEYLFERPVHTYEIPKLCDQIKEKSKEDFKCIIETAIDIDEILNDFDSDLSDDEEKCHGCEGEDCSERIYCDGCDGPTCNFYDDEGKLPFEDTEFDSVNHPKHYQTKSGIEAIDVIEAFTEHLEGIEAVCTGNVLKYMCRWKTKNGLEDLAKAKWYLQKLIDELEQG